MNFAVKIVEDVKQALREDYSIVHATIEIELEECLTHGEYESH